MAWVNSSLRIECVAFNAAGAEFAEEAQRLE